MTRLSIAAWAAVALALTAPALAVAQAADDALKVYFSSGSAQIGADQRATLDRAARVFRDGNPFVMIVTGGADTTGSPRLNLGLSVARANAVADALSDRGIPARRLQVVGRGNSELAVETADGVAERENRVVEITWR